MSFEIDWNRLLEDEANLSEKIRSFLDSQFKQLTLPPYIKSLSVTSFSLGTKAPEVTIKHISDPFPEFYTENFDEGGHEEAIYSRSPSPELVGSTIQFERRRESDEGSLPSYTTDPPDQDNEQEPLTEQEDTISPPMTPGGSLLYFHPRPTNIFSSLRAPLYASLQSLHGTGPMLVPPTQIRSPVDESPPIASTPSSHTDHSSVPQPGREDDTQFYLEVAYNGDMKLGVSATLLLNYPSPSFVTLPLKLTVTGLEIRSMAVLTYISRRIHFSFICDVDKDGDAVTQVDQDRIDIIKDIKIESEIGDQEGLGPVLRNVGKVERFLLDRIRALARDELAWPGWITFEF